MKIIVLDGHTLNPGDLSWDALAALGDLKVYDRTTSEQVVERCAGAEIILTNKVPIPAKVITQLPTLRYIGVIATGYNIIDTDTASKNNIIVSNAPSYSTASVAQLSFALMLEFYQRVQHHSDSVMRGQWAASADFSYWNYPLQDLAGKTIGVIGYGTIGQAVGKIATAFDMNILGASRTKHDLPAQANFQWSSIEQLLSESDIVSLHCPLSPETKEMINKDSLSRMKASALLINTSRGPLIHEQDLADALNTGVIAGAGLDVLSVEPPVEDNPLFHAKNCLITPHIAWATIGSRKRLMEMITSNVSAYIKGKPVNVVNK